MLHCENSAAVFDRASTWPLTLFDQFLMLNIWNFMERHWVLAVLQDVWQVCQDWLVLDRRMFLDRAIWKMIASHTIVEARTSLCNFE